MSGIPNVLIIVALVVVIIISAVIGLQLPNLMNSSQVTQTEELNSQLVNLLIQERLNNNAAANSASPTTGQAAAPTANFAPALPTEQPAAVVDEPAAVADVAATAAPPTPAPDIDYVFSYVPSREECTVATQLVVHLMESWGYHIRMDEVTTPDELYRHLSYHDLAENQSHMTFCYTDPVDREYFSTYLNEISIIGNGYYDDGAMKLYTVSHVGFAAELEAKDHCFYNFLREFNELPILLKDQTVAHFLFDNVEQVELWGNCYGHKMESAAENKQSQ
ncbi:MAG: hypothetical protein KDE47_30970 [Caldilineaceae bacterium]|nr:hypothetical protein [Caldilineaceae bacterium]